MSARCAYYVQTHRDPKQVYRLVRTLRRGSPDALVVVLHDFAHGALDEAPLAAQGAHLRRSSYPHVRGRWSGQAQPLFDTVAWLESSSADYEWLVTLTGQDYPVMPLHDCERHLVESGRDGFLRWWDVLGPDSPWPRKKPVRRYWYRYRRLPPRYEPWLRRLRPLSRMLPGVHLSLDYGPNVGVRALRPPWRDGFRCYGGWTWVALRRPAVRYLHEFLRDNPRLVDFYRATMSPEESVVQTVLVNSGRFALDNDDLRYIDYAGAIKGAPRTLTVADLPKLRSGRYCFARKFDLAVDREVLDRIDSELLAADGATAG